jgi:hypothetical protein
LFSYSAQKELSELRFIGTVNLADKRAIFPQILQQAAALDVKDCLLRYGGEEGGGRGGRMGGGRGGGRREEEGGRRGRWCGEGRNIRRLVNLSEKGGYDFFGVLFFGKLFSP